MTRQTHQGEQLYMALNKTCRDAVVTGFLDKCPR